MPATETSRITLPGQAKPLKLQAKDLRGVMDDLHERVPQSRIAREWRLNRLTVASYWAQRELIEAALAAAGFPKQNTHQTNPVGA